ncbi:hypothetical protein ASPACDRAFT_20046 [Aspergillus aculeatus ATCC 16872]|uniref:V-type ATPase, C subunit family protein n=1 Tax=Aspergillus aculeatus (strain ATCC 16872 / CBS 172.66 / WB 5094) TaxID=690307 RepID=A0A1L9X9E3_ASPA1|nr:uncharacterized protein ASPACDRAFT_20046 [Aspergillus aculeatus ATCC 16872]OJK05062.1 hypothetical protein ASPACDRAFT_20046 [Aspergillus aculeatus ATCC 16872]
MSLIFGSAPRSLPARLACRRHSYRRVPSIVRRSVANTASSARPIAYTWLTQSPGAISPNDVLSSAPPTLESLPRLDVVPIFLVTSAFASWIDLSSHTFPEQWMNQFYSGTTDTVHSIFAIVDKLPDNRPQVSQNRENRCAQEADGISMLLVNRDNIQGQLATPRRARSMEATDSGLVFSIPTSDTHASNGGFKKSIHEVGLRLANTIFINGKENTLFGARWIYNTAAKRYTLDSTLDLSNCIVTSPAANVSDSFELPLYPVGQRRRVISSMGNILRQLSKHTDKRSQDPMPASLELERDLPRYIAEHNITDQRVSVWALIETSEEGYTAGKEASQESLIEAIRKGGKLHRVMSGGGGWGKKQGLLSLDPETTFMESTQKDRLLGLEGLFTAGDAEVSTNSPPPPPPPPPPFEMRGFGEDLSTLSQAAGPGDYVQFFVSVEPSRSDWSASRTGGNAFHFGVVSDAEAVPLQRESAEQKDLRVVPGYFGGLSEKAITYVQPMAGKESTGEVHESSSKFDIPGCRVALELN